jgi:hypothetical protein
MAALMLEQRVALHIRLDPACWLDNNLGQDVRLFAIFAFLERILNSPIYVS